MNRKLSTTGYMDAISVLIDHAAAHSIRGTVRAVAALGAIAAALPERVMPDSEDEQRDLARALLIAAEALVAAADDVSVAARDNDGEIVCALDFEAAHELLDVPEAS